MKKNIKINKQGKIETTIYLYDKKRDKRKMITALVDTGSNYSVIKEKHLLAMGYTPNKNKIPLDGINATYETFVYRNIYIDIFKNKYPNYKKSTIHIPYAPSFKRRYDKIDIFLGLDVLALFQWRYDSETQIFTIENRE